MSACYVTSLLKNKSPDSLELGWLTSLASVGSWVHCLTWRKVTPSCGRISIVLYFSNIKSPQHVTNVGADVGTKQYISSLRYLLSRCQLWSISNQSFNSLQQASNNVTRILAGYLLRNDSSLVPFLIMDVSTSYRCLLVWNVNHSCVSVFVTRNKFYPGLMIRSWCFDFYQHESVMIFMDACIRLSGTVWIVFFKTNIKWKIKSPPQNGCNSNISFISYR